MKNTLYQSIIFFLFVFANGTFGQKSQAFIPEILNHFPNVRDVALSVDEQELYFSIQSYKKEYSNIVRLTKKNDKWQETKVASFSGQYFDIEPTLSNNGLKLYFASNRPKTDTSLVSSDFDIWYVKRKNLNSEWSDPINMGPTINTKNNEFYPSIAANGNFYFTAEYPDSKGKEDIYFSEFKNRKYQKPVSLSKAINSEKWEFNAFVAPDELYIIFTSFGRSDDLGGGDLYISFKDKNNNWLPAENLGSTINSPQIDYCPFVNTQTNYLYYTSEKSNIEKSAGKIKNLDELLKEFNSYPNGLSRIYYLPFEAVIN